MSSSSLILYQTWPYSNLDPMQKGQIQNKTGKITELDLELSRSYDKFIIPYLGFGIPTTPLFIQLHLFVLFQVC